MSRAVLILIIIGLAIAAAMSGKDTPTPADNQKIAAEDTSIPAPEIEVTSVSSTAGGTVAIISFRITNPSDRGWVKDIEVNCKFLGASGTVISERGQTIYETVHAKKTLSIKNINFGFINPQTKSVACRVVVATPCCGLSIRY